MIIVAQEFWTSVNSAASKGHTEVVRLLIKMRANINLANKVNKCFLQVMRACVGVFG